MPKTYALVLGALALTVVACGDGPESPTQPSPGPEPGAPQLIVKVDGADSAVAIVGASEVTFEARGTGAASYEILFGDGQSASTAKAVHVYERSGAFTATLTVTDAGGRRASTSQTVDVQPVAGTWFHLGYDERVRGAEFHRFSITAQEGATLRGVYSSLSGDRPMSGTLSSGRGVRLRVDAEGLEFEGTVPAAILAEDQPMPLRGVGGSIDGLTLPFRGVIGEPTGPAPDLRIDIRWDESIAWVADHGPHLDQVQRLAFHGRQTFISNRIRRRTAHDRSCQLSQERSGRRPGGPAGRGRPFWARHRHYYASSRSIVCATAGVLTWLGGIC